MHNIDLDSLTTKERKKLKPLYSAALLTETSSQRLLDWAKTLGIVGEGGKTYCHHITIKFKPDYDHLNSLPLGEELEYEVIAYDSRDNISAVVVVPVGHNVHRESGIDHITIWTDEVTKPAMSNTILEENKWTDIPEGDRIIVNTKIVYITTGNMTMTEVVEV